MRVERFWWVVEASAWEGGDRAAWVEGELARWGAVDVADFQVWLDGERWRLDTAGMWAAASVVLGARCSVEEFRDFRLWVIGLGREAVRGVAFEPDGLAGLPEVLELAASPRGEWAVRPQWGELRQVASRAYSRVTGRDGALQRTLLYRGHEPRWSGRLPRDLWDLDDAELLGRRLPRLGALFPWTGRRL